MEPIRLTAMMSAQMLPKALVDFATLAAIGAPIMAVILEITAKARKRSLRQTGSAGHSTNLGPLPALYYLPRKRSRLLLPPNAMA